MLDTCKRCARELKGLDTSLPNQSQLHTPVFKSNVDINTNNHIQQKKINEIHNHIITIIDLI